uniref:Glucagon like peptide 2 receptor n=1 Tax=Myripristis murdjan TaxID=586833 RepID=A0A668ABH0_9TELE
VHFQREGIPLCLLMLRMRLRFIPRPIPCSFLENLIAKRTEYSENCTRRLAASVPPKTGIYCNGTFDMFLCWPHSSPGNVSVPCPSYLPWISGDHNRSAHRECLANGNWRLRENSSEPWRDQSECHDENHYFKDKIKSLLKWFLYLLTRKLHCTRNYIHMNLFVSFILRAVAIISKEIILYIMYTDLPKDDPGWNFYSYSAVCMEYFVACNYFWLLVEAIFLHTLLFTAVLTKRRLLKRYMLLGWGTPILFVTPWTVIKILYENTGMSYLLVPHNALHNYAVCLCPVSLARATLVLIPLLGIHEVVFTVLIDECVEGSSRYARNFINLTLSSFQGFFVAVLYCFANGEVSDFIQCIMNVHLESAHFRNTPTLASGGCPWKIHSAGSGGG